MRPGHGRRESARPSDERKSFRVSAAPPDKPGTGKRTRCLSHRVAIVGGGFGGLYTAKGPKRAPVDVTLIDRHNYHLFQPLLYQVATGALSPGEIASPLRHVLERNLNTRVWMAEVTDIDVAGRKLILGNQ